jgi:hypothetical protein
MRIKNNSRRSVMADEREVKTVEVDEELYRQFFEIVGEGKCMSQSRVAPELGVSPWAYQRV